MDGSPVDIISLAGDETPSPLGDELSESNLFTKVQSSNEIGIII